MPTAPTPALPTLDLIRSHEHKTNMRAELGTYEDGLNIQLGELALREDNRRLKSMARAQDRELQAVDHAPVWSYLQRNNEALSQGGGLPAQAQPGPHLA